MTPHTFTKSDYTTQGQLLARIALRDKVKIEYAVRTVKRPLRTEFVR